MKIRDGFVSNSSTTSFTCQVCGHTEAYSDCISLGEAGGCRCENGHVMCLEHRLDPDGDRYRVTAEKCPICSGTEMDLDLVELFLLKKLGWTKDQIWEEMKKLGSYDDMVDFLES